MSFGKISRGDFLKLMAYGGIFFLLKPFKIDFIKALFNENTSSTNNFINWEGKINSSSLVGINNSIFGNQYGSDLGYNQFSGKALWKTQSDKNITFDMSIPDKRPPKPYLLDHPEAIENLFVAVQGLDIVRIWLFENLEGLIFENSNNNNNLTGLSSTLVDNLKKILDTANKYKVMVIPTLFNSLDTKYRPPQNLDPSRFAAYRELRNSHRNIIQSILKDPTSFSNKILNFLIDEIKSYPSLYAIDLINEPDWITGNGSLVNETEMSDFITQCTNHIHDVSNNKIKVTVGCGLIETAKKFSKLPIDFAQIHVYRTKENEQIENYIRSQYNGKDCLIGECGHSQGVAKEIILANEVPVTEKIISHSRDFGYSGGLTWNLFENDFMVPEHVQELLIWLKKFKTDGQSAHIQNKVQSSP